MAEAFIYKTQSYNDVIRAVEAVSVEWQSMRIQSTNGETMENWFGRIGVIGVKMSNGEDKVANIESRMSHVRNKWVIYKNQERIH